MGHHLASDGTFKSDKYLVERLDNGDDATPDKVVLSFHDPAAWPSLRLLGELHPDREFALDVLHRLEAVKAAAGAS